MIPSITILVPVYNEQECIEAFSLAMKTFLDTTPLNAHVLFINDGSTDNSADLIERICDRDMRYDYITLVKNSGLSTALKAGIDTCTSQYVGYIDADLQTDPTDFHKLIEYSGHFDLVTGYRSDRKDTVVKKISSRVANSFRRWVLHDDVVDNCCPLKVMRTDVARQMPFFNGMHRFIPDMVMLLGGTVKQIPVRHYPRYSGRSKYNLANRAIGPLIDTIVFRWMQRNAIHYDISKQLRREPAHHHEVAG